MAIQPIGQYHDHTVSHRKRADRGHAGGEPGASALAHDRRRLGRAALEREQNEPSTPTVRLG